MICESPSRTSLCRLEEQDGVWWTGDWANETLTQDHPRLEAKDSPPNMLVTGTVFNNFTTFRMLLPHGKSVDPSLRFGTDRRMVWRKAVYKITYAITSTPPGYIVLTASLLI
eukprot:scaffold1982_cov93-Amphora_coffeaeformis.AAC.50